MLVSHRAISRSSRRATVGFLLASCLLVSIPRPASAQDSSGGRADPGDAPAPRPTAALSPAILSPVELTPMVRQGETAGVGPASIYDRIWGLADIYRDDSNRIVQRVQFSGRYQHEFAKLDADEGEHDEWNVRRMRLGPKVTFLRTFVFHTEVELNPQEHDPLYVRLTDAYIQWSPTSRAVLTVGKQGVPFTMDGSTSSKDLLTIDRSNLANNIWFPQEYIPGASVSGRVGAWSYRGGLYSAGRSNRELGEFSGGVFTLGSLGYDLGRRLGMKEAVVTGSYVYQDPDPDNTFTRQLEHVGSVGLRMEVGRWGLRGDLSGARGYLGQPDLWAAMAMPYVSLTGKLQLVGRYTFLESGGPNGVRLATYESRVVPGRGDAYHELYAGANYYLYGHRLKIQTGVQFADLDDRVGDGGAYSGASWTTGLRVSW
jgi:phosphate-selective porin OprO/OprP